MTEHPRDDVRRSLPRVLGALGLGLALMLAGCGGDDAGDGHGGDHAGTSGGKAPVSATEHTEADETFATEMIQHHAQALVMVDMTQGRALDPEVQRLTVAIRDAQTPEIETMSGWLREWNLDIPETMRDHGHGGHGMGEMGEMGDLGGSDMPGMMSPDDMMKLEGAPDAEFQDRWLAMMIEHHEGAVTMAETERSDGRYRPAVRLAESIIAAQSKEIATMRGLLG